MPPKEKEKKSVNNSQKLLFVLLRGLGRESAHWLDFPQKLKKHLDKQFDKQFDKQNFEISVLCVDLPGTGEYLAMQSPASVSEIADFVRSEVEYALVHKLNSFKDANIIALAPSFGAMVAMDWIKRYPKDVSAAIFVNTSFRAWSSIFERLKPQALVRFGHILSKQSDPFLRELEVLKMVSNREDLYVEHARSWGEVYRKRPMTTENTLRQLLAAMQYSPDLQKPSIPICILNSEKDHMVHPNCSLVIAEKWKCDLKRHPTAGHDLVLDDPEWVIGQVKEFLSSKFGS